MNRSAPSSLPALMFILAVLSVALCGLYGVSLH
jgi:hypothetical protein